MGQSHFSLGVIVQDAVLPRCFDPPDLLFLLEKPVSDTSLLEATRRDTSVLV